MQDKFDKYNLVLTAMLGEAISCAPESWDRGRLFIECDGFRINYSLKNFLSHDKATLTTELAKLCEEYWSAFAENNEAWNEAVADFWVESGKWKFKVEFTRPENKVEQTKSKWKFWQ